jgi:hypothetical protein
MPEDIRARMLAERERLIAAHPEVQYAFELAEEFQEEELRREYWRWQLENSLAARGIE